MPHKLPYHEYLHTKVARHIDRLLLRLYPEDNDRRESFRAALLAGGAQLPSIFWLKDKPATPPFERLQLAKWQPEWIDVLAHQTDRPARSPFYQAGAYYPLDFSSVAVASVLFAIKEPIPTILDVCSAPGGKAIFSWRVFHPETLICNEVIGKRHQSLNANLTRCRVPAILTQLDPKQLPSRYREQCNLVMIDAPCTSQSLIARNQEAAGAFQDHLINSNMMRQRRILANSVPCVAPNGYLMYSTCTYSREENEKNVEWFVKNFPEFSAVTVPHLKSHQSTLIETACYRFEPQEKMGAGGFVVLWQRRPI